MATTFYTVQSDWPYVACDHRHRTRATAEKCAQHYRRHTLGPWVRDQTELDMMVRQVKP